MDQYVAIAQEYIKKLPLDEIKALIEEYPTAVYAIGAIAFFWFAGKLLAYDKGVLGLFSSRDQVLGAKDVNKAVAEYEAMYGSDTRTGGVEHEQLVGKRQAEYTTLVNHLYDLVTDFYEYGWGDSFHFAQRLQDESFSESIRRAQHYLALRLNIDQSCLVADVGCGIGGPMRGIAKFTGCRVTGINNNQYQINVGTRYNKQQGLDKRCQFIKTDFMNIPVPDATFDRAYEIEATCHAPDKTKCYGEIYRILKPGGLFSGYEWCVTPQYDHTNPRHRAIKEGVEQGNGLPTLATYEEVQQSLRDAGFEIVDAFDTHENCHHSTEIPWYETLNGSYTLKGFRMTWFGRICTHTLVNTLEFLGIAPKGSVRVSALLNATALDLVDGGKMQIFSPDYFFLARKPEQVAKTPRRGRSANRH